jgi:hypothetical protein
LRQHVVGTARKPVEAKLRKDGGYYLPKAVKVLVDDKLEDLEKRADDFMQKEASV